MWDGKDTPELLKIKAEYEKIFGYNPDGEMYVEYRHLERYIHDLKECIKNKVDIATYNSQDDDYKYF